MKVPQNELGLMCSSSSVPINQVEFAFPFPQLLRGPSDWL